VGLGSNDSTSLATQISAGIAAIAVASRYAAAPTAGCPRVSNLPQRIPVVTADTHPCFPASWNPCLPVSTQRSNRRRPVIL
jgi:hypothetical protein